MALADPSYRSHAYVSPFGVPVYEAVTETGVNVFVGTRNISLEILGQNHWADSYGVTDDGRPIWHDRVYNRLFVGSEVFATNVSDLRSPQRALCGQISYVKYVGGLPKVFVNDTDVTTAALGEWGHGKLPSAPSPSGIVAWRGNGPGTDNYWDMFSGTENVSSFLGAGRVVENGWVDDAGHVLWNARAPSTGGIWKVFLDRRDLASDVFGPSGWGGPRGMNRRGDVLWEGGATFSNVMLNTTSISYPVVGQAVSLFALRISENGHVLWSAVRTLGESWHLFRDDVDLTGTIGGSGFASDHAAQINASGHTLWTTWHKETGVGGVFYDDFNLSKDALGVDVVAGSALAIGDGGHCLWWWETGPQSYEIWLSTPVPEPTSAMVVPVALGVWAVARRRRE